MLAIPDLAGDQLKTSIRSEKSGRSVPRSESGTSVQTATLFQTVDLEDDDGSPSPVPVRRSSRGGTGFRPSKLVVDASPGREHPSSPEFDTPQSHDLDGRPLTAAPPCTPATSFHNASFPNMCVALAHVSTSAASQLAIWWLFLVLGGF